MPFQKGNKLGRKFAQKGKLPLQSMTIRITATEKEEIQQVAVAAGITRTEWIREAIAHYLQHCQQHNQQQNT
jgi:predicted transcriptional regulator